MSISCGRKIFKKKITKRSLSKVGKLSEKNTMPQHKLFLTSGAYLRKLVRGAKWKSGPFCGVHINLSSSFKKVCSIVKAKFEMVNNPVQLILDI